MVNPARITICITKDQYDEDHMARDEQGLYQWTWNGMNNGAFDHKVGNGAHIFYRDKPCTPFTFYGKIAQFQIIRPRTQEAPMLCKFQSSRDNLPIPFGTVCDDIRKDETFCYKRAVCRALHLSESFLNYGIIEHDADGDGEPDQDPIPAPSSQLAPVTATVVHLPPRPKATKRPSSSLDTVSSQPFSPHSKKQKLE